MDRPTTMPKESVEEFIVTPYRIYLSVLISTFCNMKKRQLEKKDLSVAEIGRLARFIVTHIQELDRPICEVRHALKTSGLGDIKNDAEARIDSMKAQGMGSLIDLMTYLKTSSEKCIVRTSFTGIFIRRMDLFCQKLSFTALSSLFNLFVDYVDGVKREFEDLAIEGDRRQVNLFFAQQVQLMKINEVKALNPKSLSKVLGTVCKNKSIFSGDLEFVRYLNSRRVRDVISSKESLISYFDVSSTAPTACCWSAFNLASLAHEFGHDAICLDAIKESVSFAQEANDDKCLVFCLLLLSQIMVKRRSLSNVVDEDILALLRHLMNKGVTCHLPSLSALAGLQLEQLLYPLGNRPDALQTPSITNSPHHPDPEILAVKNSLPDILGHVYTNRAAHFASVGQYDLMCLSSQVLLNLKMNEEVGSDRVHVVNDNTAISLRNIALFLWRRAGNFDAAMDILESISNKTFSSFSSAASIIRMTIAEISFEYHLYRNNWKESFANLEAIKLYDQYEYSLRHIQYFLKKGDTESAFTDIQALEAKSTQLTPHFNMRLMITKAEVKRNMDSVVAAIDYGKKYALHGLWIRAHVVLGRILYEQKFHSASLSALRKVTLQILSNGTAHEIADLSHSLAATLSAHDKSSHESCIAHNQTAIEKYSLINDVEGIKKALILQAHLHDRLGNVEQRNFCARHLRLVIEEEGRI